MAISIRSFKYPFIIAATLGGVGVGLVALIFALIYPTLPSLETMTDYRPKVPLRIFTADDQLLGEFGEERRAVVKLAEVPLPMKQAILAAEDARFYEHGAVDFMGVLRAVVANLLTAHLKEGGSTITMQVARSFFLSNERTLMRKLSEVLLAYKIEANLSKDQILELYINQIYLGQRAYGFGAASLVYYGRPLDQLTVSEMAMLAGLPKAPSGYNPIVNPKRAALRQQYVLRRMHELKFLNDATYNRAITQPGHLAAMRGGYATNGDFAAEMVRQFMVSTYGEGVYSSGYKVITTLYRANQDAAWKAVKQGVLDYDRRHGYRGPEDQVQLPPGSPSDDELEELLSDLDNSNELYPAVVLSASESEVRAYVQSQGFMTLKGESLQFAKASLSPKASDEKRLRRGSVIRVHPDPKMGWEITQYPNVQAALVSLDTHDGAVRALVGGFDFEDSKFNHVTQSLRQPGSTFKPFIYSAALEKGITAASIFDDSPISVDAGQNGGKEWSPRNFDNERLGPVRVRVALAHSNNLVAIKVLRAITPAFAQEYVTSRFGFDPANTPPYLSMALGSGGASPLQVASAYAVFANGGYKVTPYYIDRVLDAQGHVISQNHPKAAGADAPQVISARNAFVMTSLLHEVVKNGTGASANSLGRHDLMGKTGTTNDHVDAWFAGFQPSLVAVSWVGFDDPTPMGGRETGAVAALPIWINYMATALKAIPEANSTPPAGVVTRTIDPVTGRFDNSGPNRIPEYFFDGSQ
jgi:penicillin-binding protein 1A